MNQNNRFGLALMLGAITPVIAVVVLAASSRADIDVTLNEFLFGVIGGGFIMTVGAWLLVGRENQ